MDSLFDASFFDTAPVTKPAEKPSAIVGQLDIFGNVVDLGDVVTPDSAAKDSAVDELAGADPATEVDAPEMDPLEAAELAGELPGAPTVVDPLEQAEAEALGVVRDLDPGDVLNDPTWEPNEPIDIDEIAAVFDEPEMDLFAAPDEPETALFGEPIVQTQAVVELAPPTPEVVTPNVAIARPVSEFVADQVDADGRRNRSVDALWELVIGQGSTVETLRSAAQQPVHAYLFVGPPGGGKVRAALAFAASVLCPRGGCGECDICRRALNQTHPDLLNVEREGASISVDQAREIIRLALRSPVEGARKVLILNDFHLVTNAGPTLLKIIEEPPPSTIFLVLA